MLPLVAQMLFCICDPSEALASVIVRSQAVCDSPAATQAVAHAASTPAPRSAFESQQIASSDDAGARVEAADSFCPEQIDDWLVNIGITEYPPLNHVISAFSLRSIAAPHDHGYAVPSQPSLVNLSCQLST